MPAPPGVRSFANKDWNGLNSGPPLVTPAIIGGACLGKVRGASWEARLAGVDARMTMALFTALISEPAIQTYVFQKQAFEVHPR